VNRISFPALQVTYIDSLTDSDRATGMGFFATVRSVVSSIAPIIAAFVVAYFGGISAAGIRPLYAFTLASTVASVIILWRGLTDIGVARAKDRPSRLSFFTDIFKGERAMWQFFLMEAARGFTISMANPFFNIYAVEVKDADPFVLGLMTTSRLLITVLLAFPVGRLSDRIGRKKVVYYFRAFRYATDIGLILAPNPQFLVLVGVFRGARLIAQEVAYNAFIYELVPLEKRGRWIALSALVSGVFGAIATPLGGVPLRARRARASFRHRHPLRPLRHHADLLADTREARRAAPGGSVKRRVP
jgi:MFS family permease